MIFIVVVYPTQRSIETIRHFYVGMFQIISQTKKVDMLAAVCWGLFCGHKNHLTIHHPACPVAVDVPQKGLIVSVSL